MPASEKLECDVCVIGSGPAGATLVRELANSRVRVILVESGDLEPDPLTDELSQIENIGAPRVPDQATMRSRVLGGTSLLWTGRCAGLDAVDYEQRSWVPYSGWPFGPNHMLPYLDRSAEHLGLGVGSGYSETAGRRFAPRAGIAGPGETLLPYYWQFSRDPSSRYNSMRFGPRLLAEQADNVSILTNATVVHLDANPAVSAIRAVEVAAPDDSRRKIVARNVVLAAGGIENARILLASNRFCSAGLGNDHDVVGRFLMDHPRGASAKFDHTSDTNLRRHFGLRTVRTTGGPRWFCKGFRLSPAMQEREGLLNCAVWLSEMVSDDDPWSAVKRLARRRGDWRRDSVAILANTPMVVRGLHSAFVKHTGIPRKLDALELDTTVEQQPDPNSRMTLSSRLDRHGVPLSRVDWRINEPEQRTVRRTAELLVQELARLGVTPPKLDDWVTAGGRFPATFLDVAHPMGTTRMSSDPRQGVVDADCQVHGIDGLFAAGSSVFPTGGHANPTQMIVAMAIRLADKLKQRANNQSHLRSPVQRVLEMSSSVQAA